MDNKAIIENYLKALNIKQSIENLDDIEILIKAHLANFAFSNLKVLLKEDISLNLDDIYESIVVAKRGGYCFEHNKLMFEALKELGFKVEHYLARALNGLEDTNPPKTHRITLLYFQNERYLIDVGYGFRSPNVVVRFIDNPIKAQLGNIYEITKSKEGYYFLNITDDKKRYIATKFDLNRCYESDFEMSNFYTSKNPNAVMTNNLIVSLTRDKEVISLVNDKFIKAKYGGKIEVTIKNKEQLYDILQKEFSLKFSDSEVEILYNKQIKKV